jgi:hypothetical protein
MNRTFADVVMENHRRGLPVIQCVDGEMEATPAESLLPLAKRFLETNREPLPSQVGITDIETAGEPG